MLKVIGVPYFRFNVNMVWVHLVSALVLFHNSNNFLLYKRKSLLQWSSSPQYLIRFMRNPISVSRKIIAIWKPPKKASNHCSYIWNFAFMVSIFSFWWSFIFFTLYKYLRNKEKLGRSQENRDKKGSSLYTGVTHRYLSYGFFIKILWRLNFHLIFFQFHFCELLFIWKFCFGWATWLKLSPTQLLVHWLVSTNTPISYLFNYLNFHRHWNYLNTINL